VADTGVLTDRLRQLVALPDPPEVHLRPHKAVEYEAVTRVLAAAQRVGVRKLGVIGNEQFL
jgi:biopolymer transport protein ExbD